MPRRPVSCRSPALASLHRTPATRPPPARRAVTPRLRSSPPLAPLVSPPARARSRACGCSRPWIAGPGSARRAALRAALGRLPGAVSLRSTAPPSRSPGLAGRCGVPSIGDRSPTSPGSLAGDAHPAEASPCQGEPGGARRGGRTSAPRGVGATARRRTAAARGQPASFIADGFSWPYEIHRTSARR